LFTRQGIVNVMFVSFLTTSQHKILEAQINRDLVV
jgi:hypothetical protein